MPRGRPARPAEIKEMLGNPGKRRLALRGATAKGRTVSAPPPLKIQMPAWLTQQRERDAFRFVIESLPANLVRETDTDALARWCTWLNVFITCKLALDGKQHWYTSTSEHSPEIHREHPLAKRMDKAEAHLISLEDRLCLNIVSRNNVMHRLFNAPPPHAGAGLFADDEPTDSDKSPAADVPPPEAIDNDPMGFIERAGKPLN